MAKSQQAPMTGKAKVVHKAGTSNQFRVVKPTEPTDAPKPADQPKPAEPAAATAKVEAAVKAAAQKLPAQTSVLLSVTLLKAALTCAAKGDERHYLGGVFIHRHENKARIVASDGHRMFVAQSEIEAADGDPEWLDKGVIVPAEGLAARLSLIEKEAPGKEAAFAKVAYASGASKVRLQDEMGRCIFRMEPVDGTFPDYRKIIGDGAIGRALSGEFDREAAVGVGFQGKYLKHVGDVSKMLGKEMGDDAVQIFAAGEGDPAVVTFRGCPGAVLVLMPMQNIGVLNQGAAQILSPAVSMTIGALKAHETRNREWAEKATDEGEKAAFIQKADAFKVRWQTLLGHITPALPAPKPTVKGEAKATPAAPKAKVDLPKAVTVKGGKLDAPAKPAAPSKPRPSAKAVPPGPKAPAQAAEHKGEGRGKKAKAKKSA